MVQGSPKINMELFALHLSAMQNQKGFVHRIDFNFHFYRKKLVMDSQISVFQFQQLKIQTPDLAKLQVT